MEKAAVWERLHEDKFWDKQDCIIMSSQGQTTRGIRRCWQRINEEMKLPIYVLADLRSLGILHLFSYEIWFHLLSTYADLLAIPDVRFLG